MAPQNDKRVTSSTARLQRSSQATLVYMIFKCLSTADEDDRYFGAKLSPERLVPGYVHLTIRKRDIFLDLHDDIPCLQTERTTWTRIKLYS